MRFTDRRPLSPATFLATIGLLVACAALAVALSDRATATTAEISNVGKVKQKIETALVPDGGVGVATARCPGKTKAISGGFEVGLTGAGPFTDNNVISSRRASKKTWEVVAQSPPGGGDEGLVVHVYCAK